MDKRLTQIEMDARRWTESFLKQFELLLRESCAAIVAEKQKELMDIDNTCAAKRAELHGLERAIADLQAQRLGKVQKMDEDLESLRQKFREAEIGERK